MKLTKYLPMVALAALMASCSEEPEIPPVKGPEATLTANTSILELKQQYWQTSSNYVETIGTTDTGEDIVIKGTVISSDETGNIYKSLMINDGTAALTVAVNATKLYQTYQFGQTVYINVTGMKIGGYNNLMQLGGEGTYNGQPSMTFMAEDVLTSHAQQSGFGTPSNADKYILTTDIPTLQAAKSTAEGLQNWQSQLVRIEGVTFEDAGQPFAPTANTNRYFKDAQGNRMNLRCSSYSTFKNDVIPSGTGTVTAILSYYGSDWQMLLISPSYLEGFDGSDNPGGPDEPTPGPEPAPGEGDGSKDAPYTVSQAMALNNPGTAAWVKGYIVGVINYDNNSSLETTVPTTVATCIAIAASADETDQTKCMAVQLPVGDIRSALNLKDNPGNLGKEVALQGELVKYFGMNGIKNTAAATLDGKPIGGSPDTPSGSGDAYVRASEVTSGTAYVLWTDNVVSQPMAAGSNYGWLKTAALNLEADGSLKTAAANAYTFTQHDKGWTIQDSNGLYLYMQGDYNSFQLSADLDAANVNFFWNITTTAEGRFEILNAGNSKLVQYSSQYKSYGAYADRTTGSLPYLYQAKK